MCDTVYCALDPPRGAGNAEGESGAVSFFGKNSDRQPDEPQSVCIVAARAASDRTSLSGRSLPVADRGLAYLLSRPSWMAGGEMGVNERGVAIGNEAVFSRFKPAKDGVLGMDILRAALGSSPTAADAVEFICSFVESYDQGGNGSFHGSLYYDNSFIVADAGRAFVVETAGRRWAWRAALPRDAISNAYCIGTDYKRLDGQTRKEIAPVNERAACADESDPGRKGERKSFKEHVENRFYLLFTKGEARRALSLSLLDEFARRGTGGAGSTGGPGNAGFAGGAGGVGGAAEFAAAAQGKDPLLGFLDILRAHGPYDPARRSGGHMKSLCVHSGGFPTTATTASLAVEYRGPDAAIVWFTGTSNPCVSLYKPVLLVKGEFIPLWSDYDYAEGSGKSELYWRRAGRWLAAPGNRGRSLDHGFAAARAQAQESLAMIANKALADMMTLSDLSSLPVLAQEAGAVVAGWEQDSGFGA